MSLTQEQYKVVATVPMISGSISVIGSAIILFMIFRSTEKLKTTYDRLVFGMSFFNIIFSLGYLLSTIPSPGDIPSYWTLLYGTTTTCTIQGVMIFSGNIGCNMYNCSLAIFYMLKIAYSVNHETMKKRFEPFFHLIPLLYIVVANIFLMLEQSFNHLNTICVITPYPRDCYLNPDVPCIRGEHAVEYFWSFHGLPCIIILCVIFLSMGRVYYAIRSQEIKMRKYQLSAHTLPDGVTALRRKIELKRASDTMPQPAPEPSFRQKIFIKFIPSYNFQQGRSGNTGESSSRITRRSTTSRKTSLSQKRREAMIQCFLYVTVYFISIIFSVAHQLAIKSGRPLYPIWLLTQIFTPLQGFMNFIVFIRPRVLGFREADPELSFTQAFFKVILTTGSPRARRNSLTITQANRGRRYTTRELHMLVSSRNKEDKHFGRQNEKVKIAISQAVKELEDSSISDRDVMLNKV